MVIQHTFRQRKHLILRALGDSTIQVGKLKTSHLKIILFLDKPSQESDKPMTS